MHLLVAIDLGVHAHFLLFITPIYHLNNLYKILCKKEEKENNEDP
ncbi:hypothetical protein bmyco0003_25110 [Bacillus pseudomycoides]|nr:hypothetical protein bmyco0002_24180 [Bacillus pseudomycoides]EEM10760.1 hypothetical protein bmyco0003_25110 [Bacillus pseudomycoides]